MYCWYTNHSSFSLKSTYSFVRFKKFSTQNLNVIIMIANAKALLKEILHPANRHEYTKSAIIMGIIRTTIQVLSVYVSPVAAIIGAVITAYQPDMLGNLGSVVDRTVNTLWHDILTKEQLILLFLIGISCIGAERYFFAIPLVSSLLNLTLSFLSFKAGCQLAYKNILSERDNIARYQRRE